jgi:hypothetical protein
LYSDISTSYTWILEGLLTSKLADAPKEKVAKGPDNEMEFTMVRLLVSITWLILSTFNKDVLPAARSGNSSEDAVYLIYRNKNKQE